MNQNDEKIKIMLDANAFDKLILLSDEDIELFTTYCEIFSCQVQYNEIEAIAANNPEKFLLIKEKINYIKINPHRSFFGFAKGCSPFGQGCFQSEESRNYRREIEKIMLSHQHKDQKNDSFLATVAKDHGCIVITNDGVGKKIGLYQAIKQLQGKVLSFEELLDLLKAKN